MRERAELQIAVVWVGISALTPGDPEMFFRETVCAFPPHPQPLSPNNSEGRKSQ